MKMIQLALVLNAPKHRQEILDWAGSNQLSVKGSNEFYISVEAEPDQIAKVFEADFTIDKEGGWHAVTAPVKPEGVHAVVGLDSRPKVRRSVRFKKTDSQKGFFPNDIRNAYNIPQEYTGEGQTIGLLEFGSGYSQESIDAFAEKTSLQIGAKPVVVSVDGGHNDDGTSKADLEATLDIEWAYAIAPQANLVVYEAPGGSTYGAFALHMLHALHAAMTDSKNKPTVLSISYGDAESSFPKDDLLGWEKLMKAASEKGIITCVASGDQGAYGKHNPKGKKTRNADGPASCPSALTVGGTTLTMERNTVSSERAWTDTNDNGATGGGVSEVFQMPAYQKDAGIPGTMRGIPDVAANADPESGYFIIFNGSPGVIGGTSASCPVWAAILTGMNQQRKSVGLELLSNIHDKLYTLDGKGFRDIDQGNNSYGGVEGYQAKPGWDYCTGWGSPNVGKLASLLKEAKGSPGNKSFL
ncbi:MAG TPA: S53 family peptidase [Bacillales bacterium]|nr:S53 family peptidase [Bacillales bacterium]